MRSKEYVGALAIIAAFLLLKIGSVIALYTASPRAAIYQRTHLICPNHHETHS